MKTNLLIILLGLVLTQSFAQQATVPVGGDAVGSGGSVAYSVGQVTYTLDSDATHSIVQGVQQPYEISIVIDVLEAESEVEMDLFPNPTLNHIILRLKYIQGFSYQLLDAQGRIVDQSPIYADATTIDMNGFAASTYILKVLQNNITSRTFHIIKK